jgi:hypothetical protein
VSAAADAELSAKTDEHLGRGTCVPVHARLSELAVGAMCLRVSLAPATPVAPGAPGRVSAEVQLRELPSVALRLRTTVGTASGPCLRDWFAVPLLLRWALRKGLLATAVAPAALSAVVAMPALPVEAVCGDDAASSAESGIMRNVAHRIDTW